jgi:hypothetical protein
LGSCSPSECFERLRPLLVRSLSSPNRAYGASHEVSSPSAFSPHRAAACDRACLTRPLASSGFLNPSTLSSAPCLPALFRAGSAPGVAPFRACHLPRSRTPSPAPFPSCRWTSHDLRPPSHVRCRRSGPLRASTYGAREHPRLQGFAPREKLPSTTSGLDPCPAQCSHGLPPSRAFSLVAAARPSPCLPLMGFLRRPQAILGRPFRVSTATRLAGLLRDCRPSWALSPSDHHER